MNFGVNFVIEYRKEEHLSDWFRIVVIEDEKRIKKSSWFESQIMAHLRFRRQDYYAFSDWHKGFHKNQIPIFPVNQVISFIKYPSSTKIQTEQELRREFRRLWLKGQKRNKK